MDDKLLGMNRDISRRDFVNGIASVAAVSAMPAYANTGTVRSKSRAGYYPPAKTGLRGSHEGSYEVAHELGREARKDWGPVTDTDDVYDLIVVGAGISGLAAAHFYRQKYPKSRILLLDNHDDFGGHAKRNEFFYQGKQYLSYGGSQSMEDPGSYSQVTKKLLKDLGIDTKFFEGAYDQGFFKRHGLGGSIYFDAEHHGDDKLIQYPFQEYDYFLPLSKPNISLAEAIAQMPMSAAAKKQLLKLMSYNSDQLDMPVEEQEAYLWQISYRDFLTKHLDIDHPEVLQLLQGLTNDATSSIETATALGIISYVGLPGLKATGIADYTSDSEPYIFHFPDGNASIARMLVRQMIPAVANGRTMEDIVAAPFDYSQLDRAESATRIRLNATAVNVEHDNIKHVSVNYVEGGQAYRVSGKKCVIAAYNAIIPYLCPELGDHQADALSWSVKSPIIYTSVLLRNWQAWKKLGIAQISSASSYYSVSFLDFPVSMGGYQFAKTPDDPIVVHMEKFVLGPNTTDSPFDQRRLGRHLLFSTPFETIERATRQQLAGALAGGGFDPAKDIVGITVNRWAHGYANWFNPLFDDVSQDVRPNEVGRQSFGNIAIANSDAAGRATMDGAIDEAYRAVSELT
ncbi:MAG: FAD/NAD(P)-binding protein [Pseudomonadota bacterium]